MPHTAIEFQDEELGTKFIFFVSQIVCVTFREKDWFVTIITRDQNMQTFTGEKTYKAIEKRFKVLQEMSV